MPSKKRPWVAITATDDLPVAMTPVRDALRGIAPVRSVPLPYSTLSLAEETKYARMLQGAAGMLLRPGYVTPTLLDQLPDLKIIAVHGAGVDQVDVEACTERGVLVTNAPGANADAVAEITLCLMINLARRVPEGASRVHNERVWGEARHTGSEIRGKMLGLVGVGQIGSRVAGIAKAFGMKVCAHDPGLTAKDIRALGAKSVTFDTLLAESDYVSLHAPHIPATHHLIDNKALRRMKKGAFLINAARGALVDEIAVARALKSGRLGGAALDVLEGEPPNPKSPIFDAPNILLTPHMAGSTTECLDTIAGTAAADIARFLQNKRPKYRVNKPRR
jgi:D-3-phosphoglycerate dehydrogenase